MAFHKDRHKSMDSKGHRHNLRNYFSWAKDLPKEENAGDVPKTGTTPAKMGQNEGNVPETGASPAVRPFSLPETVAFHLQNSKEKAIFA